MANVTFSHVGKVYPDGTRAVTDLSLHVPDGELLVLVGPSGCGKTTALRMVAGLEDVTEGQITVGEQVVNDLDPSERDIAMVFQNYALYPHMSVFENIEFPLKIQKMAKGERRERVRRVARILGLDSHLHRKPRQLSGGQRQRVAMGRAIVREPQCFLMDEPLSNLDAKLRVQMRAEISSLQKEIGVTTIYVTHDQVEAMTIGDRVAVMRRSQLQQVAEPEELYRRPANLFVGSFIGSPPMNLVEGELRRADGRLTVSVGGREIEVDERERAAHPQLERHAGRPVVVGVRPERLEDASGGARETRRLRGVVTIREPLGADVLVHFTVLGSRVLSGKVRDQAHDVEDPAELEELVVDERELTFVGRFAPETEVRERETIEVAIQPGSLLFFDRDTGEAI